MNIFEKLYMRLHKYNGLAFFLSVFGVFLISVSLRFQAFLFHRPLWIDEFSTWIQSAVAGKYGLNVWSQNTYFFETHNITTHFIIAFSKAVFGETFQMALLPIFIIGVFIPVVTLLVVAKNSNKTLGILSGLLLASSYIQITWSLQLRGYVLQQLLIFAALGLYLSWYKKIKKWQIIILGILGLIGLATHILLGIFFLVLALHYFFSLRKKYPLKKLLSIGLLGGIVVLGIFGSTGALGAIWSALKNGFFSFHNNFWFYHAFLWREHSLVVFLGIIGLTYGTVQKKPLFVLMLLHFLIHMFVITFLLGPYVARYTLPVFPYLYIGMAYTIWSAVSLYSNQNKSVLYLNTIISFVLVVLVIAQGHTFVRKPETFYSVNYDMRQIAVVDYDAVYDRVLGGIATSSGNVALIDTWWDRSRYYLGIEYPDIWGYRWIDTGEFTNGLPQATSFQINERGEKYIPHSGEHQIRLVTSVGDLQMVLTQYEKGYLYFDDSTLPEDVQTYAKEHFTHELSIDSYQFELLENPYSRWPANLYSWGFESPNPFYDASGSVELVPISELEVSQ